MEALYLIPDVLVVSPAMPKSRPTDTTTLIRQFTRMVSPYLQIVCFKTGWRHGRDISGLEFMTYNETVTIEWFCEEHYAQIYVTTAKKPAYTKFTFLANANGTIELIRDYPYSRTRRRQVKLLRKIDIAQQLEAEIDECVAVAESNDILTDPEYEVTVPFISGKYTNPGIRPHRTVPLLRDAPRRVIPPKTTELIDSQECNVFLCAKIATSRCSVCKRVRYCSSNHQNLDWPEHRLKCKAKF